MKEVIYGPLGIPVSDFDAEQYAYRLLEIDRIIVSSALVVDYVRVMVKEGVLDHTQVKFTFDDTHNPPLSQFATNNGRLNQWPRGFCDHNMDALGRLLRR